MASRAARLIQARIEQFLLRKLTREEVIKCEEMNLKTFATAVITFINSKEKKGTPKEFRFIYEPIMRGKLYGAVKRQVSLRLTGRFAKVYERFDEFVGDGMGNGELEAVVAMAGDYSDEEIDAAICVAEARGIRRIPYVRGIIDGNRRAASVVIKRSTAKPISSLPDYTDRSHWTRIVPCVQTIRERWAEKMKEAAAEAELLQAEKKAARRINER